MKQNEIIYYNIGDIVIKIVSDLPYLLPDGNALDFRINKQPVDYTYIFQKIQDIPTYTGKLSLIDNALFGHELLNENGIYFRGFIWKEQFYDTVLKLNENQGIVSYLSSDILAERCQNGFNFFNYLGTEYIFSQFGGLFLHSSHITMDDRAILFSAPSGTGKSTQADLWKSYANAEIINGDRTLLRKKDDIWYAYGCPMCGTSGIHKQSSKPIHAIIMLEQGTSNTLSRLSPTEAFSLLYPQITTPRWNRQIVLKNMDLLEDVINHTPIWKYSCTKTKDAVDKLRETLKL